MHLNRNIPNIALFISLLLFSALPAFAAETRGIAALEAVRLSAVQLEGSAIITDEVRDRIVAPYLYKKVSFLELELIRNELTLWLVDNGYISSGVVIPDQEVRNGVVTMQVIGGIVTGITVSGTASFSDDYFRSRLELATAAPFNVLNLRDMLQLLHQDPQVRSIKADLTAGTIPGESSLSVKVSESRPWSVLVSSSNDNSPATGAYRGDVALSYRNAIGYGDLVSARFGGTEGGYDVSASVSIPVTPQDTTIEAFYRRGDYAVIDPLFKKLDIRSESDVIGGKISHPVVRNTRREIRPSLTIEHKESRNFLLGQGFSFTQDEADGFSELNAGRVGIEWLERSARTITVLSSTASFTTDSVGFLSWSSRLMWMQRTGWHDTRFLVRGDAQLTGKSLPSMEKSALGGMNSVRGFRKNVLVRDKSLDGSAEFFWPLISDSLGNEACTLSAFFDYGKGWDNTQSKLSTSEQQIAGAGLGLKISWKGMTADLAYALPVIKPDNPHTEDLQDKGFHFLVSWSL